MLPGRLRVVFDDAVTLRDVTEILARAGLTTVGGPTPAGVFTLTPDGDHTTLSDEALLASLRADPRVRFAESASH